MSARFNGMLAAVCAVGAVALYFAGFAIGSALAVVVAIGAAWSAWETWAE